MLNFDESGRGLLKFLIGLVLGAGLLLAIQVVRFDEAPHFHADFAIFVNGQRVAFTDSSYYEELVACDAEPEKNPKQRAHMHESVDGAVHVHDDAVTWGNFFENIGVSMSARHLSTRDALYGVDDNHPLVFVLNGTEVKDPTNLLIGDEDRLLISYGSPDPEARKLQYDSMELKAEVYDTQADPGSCGAGEKHSIWDKIKDILG